jgi:hypothetical protein
MRKNQARVRDFIGISDAQHCTMNMAHGAAPKRVATKNTVDTQICDAICENCLHLE